MTSTSQPVSLAELERTFGVLFVGFVIATVLYGFTFFQTYVYFSRYPKDSLWLKTTVAALACLDTTTSGLISQALYYYLIDQFLSPVGLVFATSTFCAENGLAILATFIVQIFFAVRIWNLSSHSWLVPATISLNALVAFAFGVTMTVQIFKQKRLADLGTTPMEAVAGISQGFASLTDLIIVVALTYYLQPKYVPNMRKPDGWFDRCITVFVNRGVSIAIIQLAYFCVFITMPSKQIWMPFHLVASKVYINSLLAILNSRDVFRGRGVNEEESITQRKSSGGLSSSDATNSGGIKFNSKAINATVDFEGGGGVEMETDHERKNVFADENGSVDDGLGRKASLAPEME